MLLKKPTEKDIAAWKAIYEEHRGSLSPNKKSAEEIIAFLKSKYSVCEIESGEYKSIVADNVLLNEFSKQKLRGVAPTVRVFRVDDEALSSCREKVFADTEIIVGVELNTSYLYVQGSGKLYDELFVFAGLDEYDLTNYFLVAQYVQLKNRAGSASL